MIDIQPSKSGGFKGTLPIELKFESDLEDEEEEQIMESLRMPCISPVRKKIKLDEPWRRRGMNTSFSNSDGTQEDDSALESSTQSGSDGDDEREMYYVDKHKPSTRIK